MYNARFSVQPWLKLRRFIEIMPATVPAFARNTATTSPNDANPLAFTVASVLPMWMALAIIVSDVLIVAIITSFVLITSQR
jgi:hypothetical protein